MKENALRELREQMKREAYDLSHRLEPVYRLLEWKWGITQDNSTRTPNREEIFDVFVNHINHVIDDFNEDYYRIASGGLFAEVRKEEDGLYIGLVGFEMEGECCVKDK